MKIITLAACLVATFLTACGGGSSSAGPEAAATTTASSCTPKTVRIQLFGDSTLWGYTPPNGERASVYPELAIQRAMDARFGPGAVVVETRAVSGTTTTNLIEGTDGVNKPWPASVNADIIVVNHGINDKYVGLPPATYQQNLRTFAVTGVQIVFQTPLPVFSTYYPEYESTSYAPEMRAVAVSLNAPVIDAGALAMSIPTWNSAAYAADGLHPNSAGYQLLADQAQVPVLTPIVAKLRCSV